MHSPYLLRDLVKVEELEMLYAEFCLGTRATEEPSVTCGQKWAEQAATPERHRGNSPRTGEKPAPEGCSDTATTPGTLSPAKEPDISL